jgi:hypothetical protein
MTNRDIVETLREYTKNVLLEAYLEPCLPAYREAAITAGLRYVESKMVKTPYVLILWTDGEQIKVAQATCTLNFHGTTFWFLDTNEFIITSTHIETERAKDQFRNKYKANYFDPRKDL